jgi:hypothetical protein
MNLFRFITNKGRRQKLTKILRGVTQMKFDRKDKLDLKIFLSKSQRAYFVKVITSIFCQSLNGRILSKSQWVYFVKVLTGIFCQSLNGHFLSESQRAYFVKVLTGISQNLNRFTPLSIFSIFEYFCLKISQNRVGHRPLFD